jgi:polar amino acid transport system substrate-binding protein
MRFRTRLSAGMAVASAAALAMSGCANTEDAGTPKHEAAVVTQQADLAALVPADLRAKGVLKIGIGPSYPPNEYVDSTGKIVGWDVELFDAVAAKLNLKTDYVNATFPQIIGGLGVGTYDLGNSSFTDTKEREKSVDFVTYFSAGSQWASQTGHDVDPDNACGLRVAAQTDTNQLLQDLPARSKKCVAAGKPPITIQSYADQSVATTAVLLGKADAVVADSPVIAYGVKKSNGKLHLDGDVYEAAPYGWPYKKGSQLGAAIQKALDALIADGTYRKLLTGWGIEGGAIDKSQINGAIS